MLSGHYKIISATEAANYVNNGDCVGVSGFAGTGVPKVIPPAIAKRAEEAHAAGRSFTIKLISGASAGSQADGELAKVGAISYRLPYQSDPILRKSINSASVEYLDLHLSEVAQDLRFHHLPPIDIALIEASHVSPNGEITLTTSSGNAPLLCQEAKKIIIELNSYHSPRLREIHDVYLPSREDETKPVTVHNVASRIGTETIHVAPEKILGIVQTCQSDALPAYKPNSATTDLIGRHVINFLEKEYLSGGMRGGFRPLQSGVGNIANSVLSCLEASSVIPPVEMFTEVAQDAVIKLIKAGRCKFCSACSLTITDAVLQEIYENFDFYKDKLLIRPQEVSNSPGICRQLGIISINTALEFDIFGNVNSSHLFGSHIMNGIGGSGDFARNAALSIFVCPSVTKEGDISTVVPMVSHTDHTEHDVKVLITEHGVADLRGKGPRARAACIIDNCAHPTYRDKLRKYLSLQKEGHTPHSLDKAFCFHLAYKQTGSMLNADI